MKVKSESEVAQLCLTLSNPMDCSLPDYLISRKKKKKSGSDFKQSSCNAGDPGSVPGLRRPPGEGNDNPFQYSCLENSLYTGAWWATIHSVAKYVFLEFLCFLYDPTNVGNLISGSSAFPKLSLYMWKFSAQVLLKPSLKDFDIPLLAWEMSANCPIVWTFFEQNWHSRFEKTCMLSQQFYFSHTAPPPPPPVQELVVLILLDIGVRGKIVKMENLV